MRCSVRNPKPQNTLNAKYCLKPGGLEVHKSNEKKEAHHKTP